MRQLLGILGDSYVIWSRNLTLMYVLLFFQLLVSQIVPKSEMPALDWRWALLAIVVALLTAAIMAGWFSMIATACTRYLERKEKGAAETVSPIEPFTLFREFLPGIGARFPQFTLSLIIQIAFIALLGFLVYPYWMKNQALVMELLKDRAEGRTTPPVLTFPQQQQLAELLLMMLASMLLHLLFMLLTMLWPAYVTLYRDNAFKAYWRSFVQFIRDPFRFLAISGIFVFVQILRLLGVAAGQSWAGVVLVFMALLAEIYTFIVLFVYAYEVVGKPVPEPRLNDDETLKDPPAA